MRGVVDQAPAAVGRHSLQVFCAGLFLPWGTTSALRLWPVEAVWLDPVLLAGGALLLVAYARRAERPRPVAQSRAAG